MVERLGADGAASAGVKRLKNARLVDTALSKQGDLYWAGGSGPDPSDHYQIRQTTRRPSHFDAASPDKTKGIEVNTNDFAAWIHGGSEPTDASKMNCWEAVFYSGYKAGIISQAWLMDLHKRAAKAGDTASDGSAYMAVLGAALGLPAAKPLTPGGGKHTVVRGDTLSHIAATWYGDATRWQPIYDANKAVIGPDPNKIAVGIKLVIPPGGNGPAKEQAPARSDLVFFDGLAHVALSLGTKNAAGNHEVMSLWILPLKGGDFNNTFQRTTIEDINGAWTGDLGYGKMPVTFGPNPW